MKASIRHMLDKVVSRNQLGINTDWDGSVLITAILAWYKATGDPSYAEFAKAWFTHHLACDHKLTDKQFYSGYIGIKSKILREGPIPFTAYCGHWGLVYTCPELYELTRDPAAIHAADAVASYILHRSSRNAYGCVYHDDDAAFTIPDTCYFVSPILIIAANLTGKSVYMEHAIHQLRAFTKLFLDMETGLSYTLWSAAGKPRAFWSRASGWLAGALANSLMHIPPHRPEYGEFAQALRTMADGIVKVQREDGGFHLLMDRPDIPVDCTAPAMIALALRNGVKLGILEQDYDLAATRAWEATVGFVTGEGEPTQAYTGWAKHAIDEDFGAQKFDRPRDFVTGLILLAAASFEITQAEKGMTAR